MRAAVLIVVLVAWAGPLALAGPGNGFGLSGGLTGHSVRTTVPGGLLRYQSAGLGMMGDAQFVINERWSLDPFLTLTLERSRGDVEATISNGSAGFQLRHWWGDVFLGGHLGYYVELQEQPGYSQTRYGPGLGAALGVERERGLTWSVQLDLPRKLLVQGETRIGLLLQAGWRWR